MSRKFQFVGRQNRSLLLFVVGVICCGVTAFAVVEQRFNDCTLVGPGAYPQTFSQLNQPSANGHLVMLGSDGDVNNPKWFHVKEAGNFVAAYYNNLNDPGYLQRTAAQKADDIAA